MCSFCVCWFSQASQPYYLVDGILCISVVGYRFITRFVLPKPMLYAAVTFFVFDNVVRIAPAAHEKEGYTFHLVVYAHARAVLTLSEYPPQFFLSYLLSLSEGGYRMRWLGKRCL